MARRSSRDRNSLVSFVASFIVIAFGLMGCIVIALIVGGQNDRQGLYVAVGVFALIALIPLGSLRPARPFEVKHPQPSWGERIRRLFGRRREREVKISTWKRKRTDFVSTPHGSEYASSFQPEPTAKKQEPHLQ